MFKYLLFAKNKYYLTKIFLKEFFKKIQKGVLGCTLPFFLLPSLSFATELSLKPFVTDQCTLFFEGPWGKSSLWKHCCVEHDLRYWFGGSQNDRNTADLRLKSCIKNVAGTTWATLLYQGIILGHYFPIKHRYHWGWAWNKKRPHIELSPAEINYIIGELRKLNIEDINIEDFIRINFPASF